MVASAGDAGACLGAASCTSDTHALVESTDTANCLSRESLACDASRFEEQLQALSDPRFEHCQIAVPYDGCGRLLLEFDGDGCLSTITTPLSPEEGIFDHFGELRACLKPIFEEIRFECLSGARLRYNESCFVR